MNAIVKSEARVPFTENEIPDLSKWVNLGTLPQASLDNVVASFLSTTMGYAGLACGQSTSSTGAPLVTIGAGLFYRSGVGYALRDTATLDLSRFVAQVPNSAKTLAVLIVVDGAEGDTEGDETFLDQNRQPPDPNSYWPTVDLDAPLMTVRSVIPSAVGGAADVQPQDPTTVNTSILQPIARVIVSNTGIVSVTQLSPGRITPLDAIAPVVASVAAQIASFQAIVMGLLAAVAAQAAALSDLKAFVLAGFADLAAQINALKSQASAPATATFRGQDNFQNLGQSNPNAPGYNAVVSSGLRFGLALKSDTTYAPATAFNNALQQNAGSFLYPAKTDVIAAQVFGDRWLYFGLTDDGGTVVDMTNIGLYTGSTFRRYVGRQRTRVSPNLQAGSAAQVLQGGDPAALFSQDGSNFVYDLPTFGDWKGSNPTIQHLAGFWNDISAHGFWTPGEAGQISGQPLASQRLTIATPMMLTEFRFPADVSGAAFFDANGVALTNLPPILRVIVCADANGQADFTNVYADVTASVAASENGFQYGRDLVAKPSHPILARPGKLHVVPILLGNYGVVLDTAKYADPRGYGNSDNRTVNAAMLSNDYLVYSNGIFAAPNPGRCLAMTVKAAQFSATTVRIDMQPLNLAGGFDAIDLLALALIPDGCLLGYEVLVGGQWVLLSAAVVALIFAGGPQTLFIRMLLQGTTTLMPVVDATVGRSAARCSKGAAALDHVSAVQNPPAPVTKVHKSIVLDGWVGGAGQTLTADLMPGPTFNTKVAPDGAPVDVVGTDGSTTRTWSWTLGSAAPSFEMELVGTLAAGAQPFVGRQSNWDAA